MVRTEGFTSGINLYSYTANNPVNEDDQDGYRPGRAGGKPPTIPGAERRRDPTWWERIQQLAAVLDPFPEFGPRPPDPPQPTPPSEPLKNFYKGPKEAPNYPKGFQPRSGPRRMTRNPIKNPELLNKLRDREPGQWQKVYHDGYDSDGNKVSQHYCQSRSGQVFDFGVSPGWSN